MENVAPGRRNLDVYLRRLRDGWRLADVDSTDQEIILTIERSGRTILLPLTAFEAAKLAGFDHLAAQAKLKDILKRRGA